MVALVGSLLRAMGKGNRGQERNLGKMEAMQEQERHLQSSGMFLPRISETLCPLTSISPLLLLSPQPLATSILPSASMSLTTFDASYKWR